MLLDIVFSVSAYKPRATRPWANFLVLCLYVTRGRCLGHTKHDLAV
jgi:hypothetical protein